jgi:hypothetical protein
MTMFGANTTTLKKCNCRLQNCKTNTFKSEHNNTDLFIKNEMHEKNGPDKSPCRMNIFALLEKWSIYITKENMQNPIVNYLWIGACKRGAWA